MKCEICDHEFVSWCRHCARRVTTWGQGGTVELVNWAKTNKDITADELLEFVYKYYLGKTPKRMMVHTLRTSLKIAGYQGKFTGRIRLPGHDTYQHIMRREIGRAHRWRLRKDKCDQCGGIENLRLHHIVPITWGGLTSDDNCITLCHSCHWAIHEKLKTLLSNELFLKYVAPHQEEIKKLARESVSLQSTR
jgi:5-methylcytosine-specific restriction endonuclease McrA